MTLTLLADIGSQIELIINTLLRDKKKTNSDVDLKRFSVFFNISPLLMLRLFTDGWEEGEQERAYTPNWYIYYNCIYKYSCVY